MINPKDPYTEADEKKFLAWVRTLPSCLSGESYDIVPAHVRRVNQGAAIARKPRVFAVPLTNDEHQYQHQFGEVGLLNKFFAKFGMGFSRQEASDWFTKKAHEYRAKWLQLMGRS